MATAQNQNAYESWYESFEGKKEGKFMTWYHSYQGKKIVNIVYSVGASVVIVGALFKILHWPGASQVLMVGMFTEAFLFLIGCLEAPHEEFHWANVFPELLEYGSPEERVVRSREQIGLSPVPAAKAGEAAPAVKASGVALSDKDLESVKSSMNDLAKAAGQLSELGKLAATGNKLGEQMEAATKAAAQYAESATSLGAKSSAVGEAYTAIAANMKGAIEGTKAYEKEVGEMGKKLSALNSVYELQLAAVQAQSQTVKSQAEAAAAAAKAQTEQLSAAAKAQTEQLSAAAKAQADAIAAATQTIQAVGAGFAKMETSASEAVKAQEAFDAAQKKLAQQVADLNKIYGNMLNALA